MVGVIVRGQHPGDSHAISFDQVEEIVDCVRRIDKQCLAGGSITDCVHKIHHLPGKGIANSEVPTGQQLTEIETIGAHLLHVMPPRTLKG